jgi:hypothetical protein
VTEPNQYYAYFTVTGDFDPADITAVMGVEPTEAWEKGDLNERTRYERKFSRWSLFSRLPRSASMESHVLDVVEQLKPLSNAVLQLTSQFEAGIPVVGFFHEDYPGMHFEPKLLSDVGALSLSLDFDFYYMYSDKREDS